jgi:t-SNARE complex subunit (syntaxin)
MNIPSNVPSGQAVLEKVIPPSGIAHEKIEERLALARTIFNSDAVLRFMDEFGPEITSAQFATRFSRTRKANLNANSPGLNYMLRDATEETYQRTQLLLKLEKCRAEFLDLWGDIESLIGEFETSKLEFTDTGKVAS